MKKIYSFLTLLVCLFIGMAAQAKTVTVTINDPDGAAVINTSKTYLPIDFVNGVAENVELGTDGGLQVSTNRGYDLKEIKVNENIVYGNYVSASEIPDGATVAITVEKFQTKHVTFTVDNPAAVSLYNTLAYQYYYFDESGKMELDLEGNATINVITNTGFDISEILIDGNPFYGQTINASVMTDNGTVAITTKEKEASVYYVEADPSLVKLTVDYTDVYDASNSENGKWTIKTTNPYASINVEATDGYVLTSIWKTEENGNEIEMLSSYAKYQQTGSIYLGSIPSGTTFTISVGKLSQLRSAHVSIEVIDGSADQISVRRGNDEIPASEFASVAVMPGVEQLYITPAVYGKSIYKVTVNGVEQEAQGSGFYLTNLNNGDVIKVWPNFPAVAVPLNISFTNEGTSGVLTLSVDGENISPDVWQAPGYTVNLGSRLGFTLNYSDYSVSSVTMNGENKSSYGFETVVQTEEPINVVITAEKLRDYEVTVYFEPGSINIFRGWGENDPVEIPAGADEVTFSVSPSNNQLNFKAAEGYIITEIVNDNGDTYSNSVYVGSDMTLTVYVDKLVRDRECVLYLQPTDGWIYSQVTLSPYTDARKDIELKSGYNFFGYGEYDCPFQIGLYPEGDVYVNGELAENVYGDYAALRDLASGSVIKVFEAGTEVPNYTLTVANKSEGGVQILADYITPIESSVAQVLGTTDVEFIVVASEAEYIIKVNDAEVKANGEGRMIATIDKDSSISVEQSNSTSVKEILSGGKDVPVYNLQGVRVTNPKDGIFIINGKKVRL